MNFLQQIVAQRAADAAVRHFDQSLIGARKIGTALGDEIGVDIHLAHVVDDDRNLQTLAIIQDMIEQRGFAGAEKSGQNGHGQPLVFLRRFRPQVRVDVLVHPHVSRSDRAVQITDVIISVNAAARSAIQ